MTKEFGYSAKPFFENSVSSTSRKIFKLFFLLGSIVAIISLYKGLTYVLPASLAILVNKYLFTFLYIFQIILLVLLRIFVEISRIITFPGAYWFWRRNNENYFQRYKEIVSL